MLRAGLWHRGAIRHVVLENPPQAGQDWAIQVPNTPEGLYWEPIAILAIQQTDANAGNRQAGLGFGPIKPEQGSGFSRLATGYALALGNSVAASTTTLRFFHSLTAAMGSSTALNGQSAGGGPMPVLRLPGGHWIFSAQLGFVGAGDAWLSAAVLAQEWVFEPAGENVPNAGDGMNRVDYVALKEAMDKLTAALVASGPTLESLVATP